MLASMSGTRLLQRDTWRGACHGAQPGWLSRLRRMASAMRCSIEHVIDYNFEHAKERYMAIAQAIGLDLRGLRSRQIRRALINDLVTLKNPVGNNRPTPAQGVRSADIPCSPAKRSEMHVC